MRELHADANAADAPSIADPPRAPLGSEGVELLVRLEANVAR